jgi:hypothetical protein
VPPVAIVSGDRGRASGIDVVPVDIIELIVVYVDATAMPVAVAPAPKSATHGDACGERERAA